MPVHAVHAVHAVNAGYAVHAVNAGYAVHAVHTLCVVHAAHGCACYVLERLHVVYMPYVAVHFILFVLYML